MLTLRELTLNQVPLLLLIGPAALPRTVATIRSSHRIWDVFSQRIALLSEVPPATDLIARRRW